MLLRDFIEAGGPFVSKSGKINKPSSISIAAEQSCFCRILLIRAATLRVSLEKSTSPQAFRLTRKCRFLHGFLNLGGSFASESGKTNTAEGGSTQRKPSDRCLPLRPADLWRFNFVAGPEKEHRRGGKYAEKTEHPLSSSASFRSLAV